MENYNTFRNLRKMNSINDGTRTLNESIMALEVLDALNDWKKNQPSQGVLIGGIALSFYVKPRYTTDADFLFLTTDEIPEKVENFKRHRKSAFEHKRTGVEIEVLTPSHIKVPANVAKIIIETSTEIENIRVASPSGIVASKLFRFSLQDKADIASLLKSYEIDLSLFNIPQKELNIYSNFLNEIQ
jgi:hypothetical protein